MLLTISLVKKRKKKTHQTILIGKIQKNLVNSGFKIEKLAEKHKNCNILRSGCVLQFYIIHMNSII